MPMRISLRGSDKGKKKGKGVQMIERRDLQVDEIRKELREEIYKEMWDRINNLIFDPIRIPDGYSAEEALNWITGYCKCRQDVLTEIQLRRKAR